MFYKCMGMERELNSNYQDLYLSHVARPGCLLTRRLAENFCYRIVDYITMQQFFFHVGL